MSEPHQQPAPQVPAPQHSGYPSTSPGFAGQPYAAAPFTAPSPQSQDALGRVSFIIAVIGLGISLLGTLTMPLLLRNISFGTSGIGLYSGLNNLLVFVVALTALVLGLIAVRRSPAKVLPGIAIGITAAQIIGILVGWSSTLLYSLSYL